MKIVKSSLEEIIFHVPEGYSSIEKWLEIVSRNCYKSEDKITEDSYIKILSHLIDQNHLAMIEHAIVSARIISDRGFMAEITRHRLSSFAIESTRYCRYSKDKFGSEITVIEQPDLDEEQRRIWTKAMEVSEQKYMELLNLGVSTDIARSVLPTALKTEIIITANLRQWINIIEIRATTKAHPLMREIIFQILDKLADRLPIIFKKQTKGERK
jgi:thymidylate synthase (FAD)